MAVEVLVHGWEIDTNLVSPEFDSDLSSISWGATGEGETEVMWVIQTILVGRVGG